MAAIHLPSVGTGSRLSGQKSLKDEQCLVFCRQHWPNVRLVRTQPGQHHDLYEIKALFAELCGVLKDAAIDCKGIFLNADAGFDGLELKYACAEKHIEANIKPNPRNNKGKVTENQYFDEELYKRRTVIENANAWMDSYKALLVRYEALTINWMAMHWIAFSVFFLKRINKKLKV